MGKAIINVSNDFFDVDGKEGDMMYSFTGTNAMGFTKDSVLRGKTINLNDMYDNMLDGVRDFLFGGEYVSIIDKVECRVDKVDLVNKYTFKKYGICIENVYNKIHGNIRDTTMTTDIIFNELKVKYGMTGIDWMYLYNSMSKLYTNNADILEYICNSILSNEIYEYFVAEYNLRTVGVVKKVKDRIINNVRVDKFSNFVKVEWDNKTDREIDLGSFIRSYKQWWMKMTGDKNKNRGDIRNYDVLLNGRSVKEVFPVYCPVFTNLRLNYTGIDFDGKNNIKKCSEIAGYSDKGETWSFASIDRIDSRKGYSYDNISIISQYANHLKNVGSKEQIIRLGEYLKNNE